MTLNHNEAIARVTVDGLAVACFNSGQKTWDLAFLRLQSTCHDLLLTIEGEPPIPPLDESVGLISFETVNGRFPDGFPRGFVDSGPVRNRRGHPRPGPETENFRWVIDLEDDNDVPHGFLGLKKPAPPTRLTRTFIQNAVFYTLNVAPQDLILVHDGVDPNGHSDPPLLGKTNDEISADIFCNPGGELLIKIDGQQICRKPDRPGNPWKICLTNLCIQTPPPPPPRLRKGDFQHFYEVIRISGQRHALWGDPQITGMAQCFPRANPNSPGKSAPQDFLSGRPDCDTSRLGTTQTLDELFR